MSIPDLALITMPALSIVVVAVCLARRERADVIVDLRDVPSVPLAVAAAGPTDSSFGAGVTGQLIEPRGTGSLGARLRSTECATERRDPDPEVAGRNKVMIGRRRRPLVAVSRLQEQR